MRLSIVVLLILCIVCTVLADPPTYSGRNTFDSYCDAKYSTDVDRSTCLAWCVGTSNVAGDVLGGVDQNGNECQAYNLLGDLLYAVGIFAIIMLPVWAPLVIVWGIATTSPCNCVCVPVAAVISVVCCSVCSCCITLELFVAVIFSVGYFFAALFKNSSS